MTRQTVLTGITTTGIPHLGNYVGAIRPAIEASRDADSDAYYFLADYHALVKNRDPKLLAESSLAVAATWLALGLDTDNSVFYRQSDVPQIAELSWILSTVTAKGLMNRSHAYKAAVQDNEDSGSRDPDKGITMGLFSYPVLMAADILMFNAHQVPVGKDQIQHVEMARDIAQRFNHIYGEVFVLPEASVDERAAVLTGLDGRKMSKSYNNTIPLFLPSKQLRKHIMKIKTNSLEPGEPKDPDTSTVFELYKAFAAVADCAEFRSDLQAGLGWGEAKQRLFECLDAQLSGPRDEYQRLLQDPAYVEAVVHSGGKLARKAAADTLKAARDAVGIGRLTRG